MKAAKLIKKGSQTTQTTAKPQASQGGYKPQGVKIKTQTPLDARNAFANLFRS